MILFFYCVLKLSYFKSVLIYEVLKSVLIWSVQICVNMRCSNLCWFEVFKSVLIWGVQICVSICVNMKIWFTEFGFCKIYNCKPFGKIKEIRNSVVEICRILFQTAFSHSFLFSLFRSIYYHVNFHSLIFWVSAKARWEMDFFASIPNVQCKIWCSLLHFHLITFYVT